MSTVLLRGREIENIRQLHEILARELNFPAWYGKNLDALYDLLTQQSEPQALLLEGTELLQEHLGADYQRLLGVLTDAAAENPMLQVVEEPELLESRRLLIRRELPSDFRAMFAWSGDSQVYEYLLASPTQGPEDVLPRLRSLDTTSREQYVMILLSREDGHAVGTVGMFYGRETDRWSLAYTIRREDWGRGYAAEAAQTMMDYIRAEQGPCKFEAECAEENLGSRRVLEKLGFAFHHQSSYEKHDGSRQFASRVYWMD